MDNGEADELGRFRRNLEQSDLNALVVIVASVLDECIDTIREMGGQTIGVELAAAVSAELHKRALSSGAGVRAPMVGTA